jgi:hypothetical protein
MARHARQHKTTKIEWSTRPEADAQVMATRTGGVAKEATLSGETVWCVAHADNTYTAFLWTEQGRKIGLCMYRWCPRKASECGYHSASRRAHGLGQY